MVSSLAWGPAGTGEQAAKNATTIKLANIRIILTPPAQLN
jgi:hypothetical protein